MNVELYDLKFFVSESNRIEGIKRAPTKVELQAHADFLALEMPRLGDVSAFVKAVAGRTIRNQFGMDVRVGNHVPPRGGPEIVDALMDILDRISGHENPWSAHVAYETLHPFMDGNGRSGRVLWLWQMLHQQEAPWALRTGFLHLFYYQTLSGVGRVSDGDGNTMAAT